MIESSAVAFLINMIYFLVTVLVIRMIIGYMNRSTGTRLGELLHNVIYKDPLSAAIYRGSVFVGLCIVAAAFLR